MRARSILIGAALGVVLAASAAVLVWKGRGMRAPNPPGIETAQPAAPVARFVGRQACAGCHRVEMETWRGSHHDLAMQEATEQTVLGNFRGATFRYFGVNSTFFKRGGKFMVRTDGPDGKLHDYPIVYTFGIYPLQEYLIKFPGGRIQALNICWDCRPAREGGQRWFHLYPNEKIAYNDILHWTGPAENWNHMCAECHSTNIEKGYRPEEDRFETTWSETNVSCEACHGPASNHVAWASGSGRNDPPADGGTKGLVVFLRAPQEYRWEMNPATGSARRDPPLQSRVEVETCARCHSRSEVASDRYVYGKPILDSHRVSILEEVLYHDDGQIKDEVYEYGSFLQSRMYAAGVTCTDCHDPHSLRVDATDPGICARCHLREKFATAAHHHHAVGSRGSRCLDCHMPTKNYMVVHARHDHSFRVPRPDLSVKIGTPNACTGCHPDRTAQWAAAAAAKWWGTERTSRPHYGEAIHAGRMELPGAEAALTRVAGDPAQPGIVRATAVSVLRRSVGSASLPAVEGALKDADPLVRIAATDVVEEMEPAARLPLLVSLLTDPIRIVRIDAAKVLAWAPRDALSADQRAAFEAALEEYRESQRVNADRAEAHLNLGVLHLRMNEWDEAEREYRIALKQSPYFAGGYLNLADLYRQQGRDADGERVLRTGLEMEPRSADLHHALGLLLVRRQRLPEALQLLQRAAELAPDRAHYAYVYGVGLHSAGRVDDAIQVLGETHRRHPGDGEVLMALATFSRDRGRLSEALEYARKLASLFPESPEVRGLLEELNARMGQSAPR